MSSFITAQLDNVRKEIFKIPTLKQYAELVEGKTHVPVEYFLSGLVVLLAALLFIGIGGGIITNLIGFVYPMYCTIKAIEYPEKENDVNWLVYWVVFGLFCVLDNFIHYVLYWIPIFYPIKVTFLLWCMLPKYKGARVVYDGAVKPMFLKHVSAIDAALSSMDSKKVTETAKTK